MVVRTNISALNTARHGGIITGNKNKSIEKLSSGYRINRAADDAAGLSISEKLRWQARGLARASQNALDGVSLLQTAEGALNEVHSILQRMNELSLQAANDTNTSIDREAIGAEIDQLAGEIDRIGDTTEFNTKKLLCGLWQENGVAAGPSSTTASVTQGSNVSAANVSVRTPSMGTQVRFGSTNYLIGEQDRSVYRTEIDPDTGEEISVFDHYEMSQKTAIDRYGREISQNTETANDGKGYRVEVRWPSGADGYDATTSYQVYFHAPLEFELQIGALGHQGITASLDRISAATLDVEGLRLDSFQHAGDAAERVQGAIDKVSEQRAALGATQNRLEHTILNLDNTAENTVAAESRIRDADMAREMVEFSKQSIMEQVSQTLLSQGAHSNEAVLALLK